MCAVVPVLCSLFDDGEARYRKLRASISRFTVTQIGEMFTSYTLCKVSLQNFRRSITHIYTFKIMMRFNLEVEGMFRIAEQNNGNLCVWVISLALYDNIRNHFVWC